MSQIPDYKPNEIEKKWQAKWAQTGIYEADMDSTDPERNFYLLMMFPYPSGTLHTGHWYNYAGVDVFGRFKRLQGHNVFMPFGYDSFGLPAENAAIKNNIHPAPWTRDNIKTMTQQLKNMGTVIDWRAVIATSEPEYYKWNQWFFLKFHEMGLAYREFAPVDWCPSCNTTLAREQVKGDDRRCDRCGTQVIKKELDQWKFRITNYADELLDDLEKIDWPERIKSMQRNWIGKSRGANIRFPIQGMDGETIEVFTTRPDTIYGATFMVLAPEHPLVTKVTSAEQAAAVEDYKFEASRQSETERQATDKEKSGVFTGGYAINPLNGAPIEIWIADYVLMGYGTGAIMAVPGGDQRDFEFATKFGLPIVRVTEPVNHSGEDAAGPYDLPGRMINSGLLDGLVTIAKYTRDEWTGALSQQYGITLDGEEAKEKIIETMEQKGIGEAAVSYRLRDWLISRQRFWGTPIPMVYCEKDGIVRVPYEQLPVLLPMDVDFMPTGVSPLRSHAPFLNTTCPTCGGPATRDTDTMDTFVDSSWYQYRYLSPHNDQLPFDPEDAEAWIPPRQYIGGAEHAVMHLLYTRFWTKVMRDMGLVTIDEPFPKLFNQGMILGPDYQKMSKSRGNVVDPDELVARYGADVVRGYLMFIGPWDQGGPFSMTSIEGISRFYGRVWSLVQTRWIYNGADTAPQKDVSKIERAMHQAIKRVGDAYESFSFNVAVAALMEFSNAIRAIPNETPALVKHPIWDEAINALLVMLAPVAPHITEELWAKRGNPFSIHQQAWPVYDEGKAREDSFELVVQHNGKVRDRIQAATGINEADATALALSSQRIQELLADREPKKVIYVPGKLINIVG